MKKAMHYGAGNIGRGFLGQLLSASGYEITFVDVQQEVIDDINNLGKYTIEIVGDAPQEIVVEHVRAINGGDVDLFVKNFVETDVLTTAIGPNILKFIAPNIAKGIEKRVEVNSTPLNIIACENMVGGSQILKGLVYEHLSEDVRKKADALIAFPNAAVDRIVPIQHPEEKLRVAVEEYCELDVDATMIKGERPPIQGIHYVDDLGAYIERKLFTLNTGHASTAYLAYQKGIKDIYHAMQDEEIVAAVREVWKETGELLVKKHGFDPAVHQAYIEKSESRFKNPHISDEVTRVGRGPIRKLGAADRLVAPAAQLIEMGKEPEGLALVIAAAMKFDCKEDPEAVELQDYIKANGVDAALKHFSGIETGSKLHALIRKYL
ncbi:mannitol-1-phosphate 5-dehydrogenase [Selenomonas sp. TAMA-11512]|uniref:mannitol-1-phosphate 5-dehydrogenase n=1 Tax=Selenomonas sp. TAMA-11512 TaxID=3095337 RepID=UPI003090EF9B|nr:mannitol-1-phosphate 5-dehydrogenase [Selenomonas sp. TAMA-11512]